MEMNSKQQEFIILRADGLSYDKISLQLKTSKPTLIQWSKLFEDEIKNIQFEAFIKIKEAYSWNTKKRYETLLKQVEKIDETILNIDYSQTPLKDLVTIKNNLLNRIDTIERRITSNSKISKTNEFGYKEQLDFKLNEVE